jgi:uncharacterized protein (TIGR01777 family)
MGSEAIYERSVDLPVPPEVAFAYHERPGALQRLIPPWESVTVERSDNSLTTGSQVLLRQNLFGIGLRWLAEHGDYQPPFRFMDRQVHGPFRSWLHEHLFQPNGSGCKLTDRVRYTLPMGVVGRAAGGRFVANQIDRMFRYRHATTEADLRLFVANPLPPMRIAISGASGLVGRAFGSLATLAGHSVERLVRGQPSRPDEISLAESIGATSTSDPLEGCGAIVHLAGKGIAESRWTDRVKEEIRASRVVVTERLCRRVAALKNKPKVLLCASAIGIYGDRGRDEVSEDSKNGEGFLAEVGRQWEQACQPAVDAGIRVVQLRFGIILSPQGGALQKMLLPAKLLGGKQGSGQQWMSWISIDDCVGSMIHALAHTELSGPVNVVAPGPVQNREFAKVLGSVLKRPALFPAPAMALRFMLGEMADALLLTSTRVQPKRLQQSGYAFRHPQLESALRHLLGR